MERDKLFEEYNRILSELKRLGEEEYEKEKCYYRMLQQKLFVQATQVKKEYNSISEELDKKEKELQEYRKKWRDFVSSLS